MFRPYQVFLVSAGTLTWCIALLGLHHVIQNHIAKPTSSPTFIVLYLGALVALAGWMVQSWISMRNSRKQHTINVLFQSRLGDTFSNHYRTIQCRFPNQTPIDYEAVYTEEEGKVLESLRFFLNYYEFISVGILHGDLDEPLMRDCICTQFCTFYRRCEDFIKKVRAEDEKGIPAPDRARILVHFRNLYIVWSREVPQSKAAEASEHRA